MLIPDEVKISLAKSEIFNAVAVIVSKYDLPQACISLLLKSVLLDIKEGELRQVCANNIEILGKLEEAGIELFKEETE